MGRNFFRAFLMNSSYFILMLIVGILFINLFYAKEKLQMISLTNQFHEAQLNNDKNMMNMVLTDDFTESGVSLSVKKPNPINKTEILNFELDKTNFKSIEMKYVWLLNVLNTDNTSMSFIREVSFSTVNGKTPPSFSYYVTYYFEETSDGLKINKIVRNF